MTGCDPKPNFDGNEIKIMFISTSNNRGNVNVDMSRNLRPREPQMTWSSFVQLWRGTINTIIIHHRRTSFSSGASINNHDSSQMGATDGSVVAESVGKGRTTHMFGKSAGSVLDLFFTCIA